MPNNGSSCHLMDVLPVDSITISVIEVGILFVAYDMTLRLGYACLFDFGQLVDECDYKKQRYYWVDNA